MHRCPEDGVKDGIIIRQLTRFITTMSPAILGFIRGIAVVVLTGVLTYVGDASHLTGVTTPYIAAIVSALALALENHIEGKTGKAAFGAVKVK